MPTPKILAFAGSVRKDSFNKMLVQIAVAGARDAGAEVTYLDLREYPLPIYDGDLEAAEGLPANAVKLKKLFTETQGMLISSPEYNSSVSAVLKNTIDWISRPQPNEKPLAGFAGKVATLMSASPGALGGLRGLVHLRSILSCINVIVLPGQIAIPKASEAFSADGSLKDEKQQTAVKDLGKGLTEAVGKFFV